MSAAPKTLLEIVNAALGELGLPQTDAVIVNPDPTVTQMRFLINAAGEDLRDAPEDGWTVQQVQFNLVVSPPLITTGNTVTDSPVITGIPDTTGLDFTYICQGADIPVDARILSVDSLHQVTLDMEMTGTVNDTPLTFAKDTYDMPADFRAFINRTWWDRTNRWQLLGPDSPQLDQWHRSGIVTTGPRRHFRVVGRPAKPRYRLWPPPAEIVAPLQLVFEYQSTDWVSSHGTGLIYTNGFENDDDVPTLSDRALIKSLKWRFWEIKGFNFENWQNQYLDYVDWLIASDGGADTLNLVKRVNPIFISPANVQDGFFPGPVGPNN